MLVTSSCCTQTLKFLYMLSHSIFINLTQLPELQINIAKAIDPSSSWNIRNFLYITKGLGGSDEINTATQSKEDEFIGKIFRKNSHVSYDPQLQNYFTEIRQAYLPEQSLTELQTLAKKSPLYQSQLNRYFTYESILESTRFLTSSKFLPIKQFHSLNTKIVVRRLLEQTIQNFNSFLHSFLGQKNKFSFSQIKQVKTLLSQGKEVAISSIIKHQCGWLGDEKQFRQIASDLKKKIEIQENTIIQTIIRQNEEYVNRILQSQNSSKYHKLIGNEEIDNFGVFFSTYVMIIKKHINNLFQETKHERDIDETSHIKNSDDVLKNLDDRIGIYQQKKNTCQNLIQLAKQQQNSLNQLVYGLKIKRQPYVIISK